MIAFIHTVAKLALRDTNTAKVTATLKISPRSRAWQQCNATRSMLHLVNTVYQVSSAPQRGDFIAFVTCGNTRSTRIPNFSFVRRVLLLSLRFHAKKCRK